MRKIILIATLMIFSLSCFSQVLNLRTEKMAYIDRSEDDAWSGWKEIDVMCLWNLDDDVISIYTRDLQIYYLLEKTETLNEPDGNIVYYYNAIDKKNHPLIVKLRLEKELKKIQVYIVNGTMEIVYTLK